MIKGVGIKKEAGVVEYYGITLADDMVGRGLVKDENGVVSVDVKTLVKTTWAELKALRDEAKLNAGTFYRITDYVTTTTQEETKSANHPFDVIVLALSENTLCEDAKAILHEGDTYFADSDLSAWELKYCLDNDKARFEWADETNGKGVIYRMVDEKRNDCPYDFKNILFHNTKLTGYITSDNYYYTFSYLFGLTLCDGTTDKRAKYCYGNVMGKCRNSEGVLQLNMNVFRNLAVGGLISECHSNTFGDNCSSNTFGYSCHSNTFGYNCHSNTFGYNCHSNTFGNSCSSNTFGNGLQNHRLNSEKTVTTQSEEFYDDGSGQLVPTKHPDLSTQPSILPYKFMGQYVYEQLIPHDGNPNHKYNTIFYSQDIAVEKPIFLEAQCIMRNGVCPCNIVSYVTEFEATSTGNREGIRYIRVVYTSMPEEGDYYGYNNY